MSDDEIKALHDTVSKQTPRAVSALADAALARGAALAKAHADAQFLFDEVMSRPLRERVKQLETALRNVDGALETAEEVLAQDLDDDRGPIATVAEQVGLAREKANAALAATSR